ncbi:hypothetical protein STANM309S_06244 [Streptomyces tanashiensis]
MPWSSIRWRVSSRSPSVLATTMWSRWSISRGPASITTGSRRDITSRSAVGTVHTRSAKPSTRPGDLRHQALRAAVQGGRDQQGVAVPPGRPLHAPDDLVENQHVDGLVVVRVARRRRGLGVRVRVVGEAQPEHARRPAGQPPGAAARYVPARAAEHQGGPGPAARTPAGPGAARPSRPRTPRRAARRRRRATRRTRRTAPTKTATRRPTRRTDKDGTDKDGTDKEAAAERKKADQASADRDSEGQRRLPRRGPLHRRRRRQEPPRRPTPATGGSASAVQVMKPPPGTASDPQGTALLRQGRSSSVRAEAVAATGTSRPGEPPGRTPPSAPPPPPRPKGGLGKDGKALTLRFVLPSGPGSQSLRDDGDRSARMLDADRSARRSPRSPTTATSRTTSPPASTTLPLLLARLRLPGHRRPADLRQARARLRRLAPRRAELHPGRHRPHRPVARPGGADARRGGRPRAGAPGRRPAGPPPDPSPSTSARSSSPPRPISPTPARSASPPPDQDIGFKKPESPQGAERNRSHLRNRRSQPQKHLKILARRLARRAVSLLPFDPVAPPSPPPQNSR